MSSPLADMYAFWLVIAADAIQKLHDRGDEDLARQFEATVIKLAGVFAEEVGEPSMIQAMGKAGDLAFGPTWRQVH